MYGIEMNELKELISHCHEAEFEYNGTTYVLQPEVNDGNAYLVIWDCTPDSAKCIAKHEIKTDGDIPPDVIFRVKKVIEEIAEKNDGKTVVIGTHGGTIRAMQAAWCDSPLDKVGEFSSISNCAVTIAEYSSGSLNFIKTGFTEHLNNVKTDCLKN